MSSPTSRQFSGIFINYRRDDSAGHAGRLFDGLSDHFGEDRIFMDVDHIEPGQDFVEVLEKAVDSCEILLTVIGRHWLLGAGRTTRRLDNPQDFVRLEVTAALRRGIRVIPVLVQGAVMPRPDELPEDLAPLSRRQAVELRDQHWRTDIKRLNNILEKVLAEREAERLRAAHEEEERLRLAAAEEQRRREEEQRQRAREEEERQKLEEAAAEEERRRLEEEEKRKSAEAAAAKAAQEQREREAEEERQRAAEAERQRAEAARRAQELERERRQAAEAAHQRRKAEEAQRRMHEEAAAVAERRRLEEEEKRKREADDALNAAALAAEKQKRLDDEERRKQDAAREAAEAERRQKEEESQVTERPPDQQKQPDTTPAAMFSTAAPTSGHESNRVVLIALCALVAMGVIAAVWLAASKGSPRPPSGSQSAAAATGTQPPAQTANVPLAATPTPSPIPKPIPTPDKATFQKTLNAFIRKELKAETQETNRKIAYGDLDGDGADDAAVSFCIGPRGGTAIPVCDLAIFRNENGVLKHATGPDYDDDVAADEVQSIKDGKIYCITYEHRDTDPHCCPSLKRQVKVALVGNTLKRVRQ